jgi:hypothetical protein
MFYSLLVASQVFVTVDSSAPVINCEVILELDCEAKDGGENGDEPG